MIAVLLPIAVFLPAFGFFACDSGYFCSCLRVILLSIAGIFTSYIGYFFKQLPDFFYLQFRVILPAMDGILACDCGFFCLRVRASNATNLTQNILAVFTCIRQTVSKVTIEKNHSGVRQVEFFGRTIPPKAISPRARIIQNLLSKPGSPNKKRRSSVT